MKRVALVVPGLEEGGGVPAVALFLARIMRESGRYEPHFISLPMGSSDPMSVSLRAPSTWKSGARVAQGEWGGEPFSLVGNHLSEFEFQRYRPRCVLTDLLAGFDLVQIVAGAPAWGWIARDLTVPVALQAGGGERCCPCSAERRVSLCFGLADVPSVSGVDSPHLAAEAARRVGRRRRL